MDRRQRKEAFDLFYQQTYSESMTYCMGETGDFLNGEDLLVDAYYEVYRAFMKAKKELPQNLSALLNEAMKKRLAKYWDKHRKDLLLDEEEEQSSLAAYLYDELDLTDDEAKERLLVLDILEFVSMEPAPLRRAFAYYFYLGKSLEETAVGLRVSVHTAENYLCMILHRIREEFLDEFTE